MKSRYDHNELQKLASLLKATQMCDEVATVFENTDTFSNDLELLDVTYSYGDIIADFAFSCPENLKQNIGIFNPREIVKTCANGTMPEKILPKDIADQIHIAYTTMNNRLYKNEKGQIVLYSILNNWYCVQVRLTYKEQ